MPDKKKKKYVDSEPIRSYAAVSLWHTNPVSVSYDEITGQISIFQGAVHLSYPVEGWLSLVRAVTQVLPVESAE